MILKTITYQTLFIYHYIQLPPQRRYCSSPFRLVKPIIASIVIFPKYQFGEFLKHISVTRKALSTFRQSWKALKPTIFLSTECVFPGKRVWVVFEATSPLHGRHRCPFLSRSYLLSSRADSTKIRTIYISAHIQLPKSHLTTVFVRYSQRHREYSAWRSNKPFCEWSPSTRASERKPKSNVSMALRLVLCALLTSNIKACLNILPIFNGNWRTWL